MHRNFGVVVDKHGRIEMGRLHLNLILCSMRTGSSAQELLLPG